MPRSGGPSDVLANLVREFYDKELSLIITITTLNQNFTDLINNKIVYCDVAYKGLNHHN